MYHCRFKGSHYDCGLKWGSLLRKNNIIIAKQDTFIVSKKRKEFTKKCIPIYQKYYPEVLEEIKGIANGQGTSYEDMLIFLLSMYCFEFNNKCTCIAYSDQENIFLGRNSDFLVQIEKLCMNCIYTLNHGYAFNGNTTAFVEMEDGVNEFGLAVGLTFVYSLDIAPGFNGGMLVRYMLEKCKTVFQAIKFLQTIPIASSQSITLADASGEIAVVECNSKDISIIYPDKNGYVVATNNFNSINMIKYANYHIDNWHSLERYQVALDALKDNDDVSKEKIFDILSGKYGFMCQYDRKTGADTVWSVGYDLLNKKIYRVEGNPSRKKYKEDTRFKFLY